MWNCECGDLLVTTKTPRAQLWQSSKYGIPVVAPKSTRRAYGLLTFLGILGAHHFYLGQVERGSLYLATLGLFGLGVVYDLVFLSAQVRRVNMHRQLGVR